MQESRPIKYNEQDFYRICDKVETLSEHFTNNWFPSVEFLKKEKVDAEHPKNIIRALPLMLYFQTNPLKNILTKTEDMEKYEEALEYINSLIDLIELKESTIIIENL